MRSRPLYESLKAFVEEARAHLAEERSRGAELPFDVVEVEPPRPGRYSGTALYCYRPLTAEFIGEREDALAGLPSHLPALHALSGHDGLDRYLHARGWRKPPTDPREAAGAVLRTVLREVFHDASEFEPRPERFEAAYEQLERSLFSGTSHTEVLAVLDGLLLESDQVEMGAGLSFARAGAVEDAPAEVTGREAGEPRALLLYSARRPSGERGAVQEAAARIGRLMTALRLFGDSTVGLEPLAWMRTDGGPWRALALGGGAPAQGTLLVSGLQEDELRAFTNLISRRTPRAGELAWALRRFELGCERAGAGEALTDHLLALRALLEPEGASSGRLAGRLAVLCAVPTHRAGLASRVSDAVAVERAVIAGVAPAEEVLEPLADEMCGHLRALLRDVLCGHLEPDLSLLADRLIAEESSRSELEAA